MNKLQRQFWFYGAIPLTVLYLILGISMVSLEVLFLAVDQCQFLMDRNDERCWLISSGSGDCPVVGNLGCPKFVEAKYKTFIFLGFSLPVILLIGTVWNIIRVFKLSESEKSYRIRLATRISVLVVPSIFILLFVPYLLLLGRLSGVS